MKLRNRKSQSDEEKWNEKHRKGQTTSLTARKNDECETQITKKYGVVISNCRKMDMAPLLENIKKLKKGAWKKIGTRERFFQQSAFNEQLSGWPRYK